MGHLNIVLLLLQNGASPDVRNIVSAHKSFVQLSVVRSQEYIWHKANSILRQPPKRYSQKCFIWNSILMLIDFLSLHTSVVRQLSTWRHGQVRWKWFAVC